MAAQKGEAPVVPVAISISGPQANPSDRDVENSPRMRPRRAAGARLLIQVSLVT